MARGAEEGRKEKRERESEREEEECRSSLFFPSLFFFFLFCFLFSLCFPFKNQRACSPRSSAAPRQDACRAPRPRSTSGASRTTSTRRRCTRRSSRSARSRCVKKNRRPKKKKKKKNLGGSPSLFLRVCGVLPHGQSSRGSQERSASTPMGVDRVGRSEGLENERVFLALPPSSPLLSHSLSRPPPPLSWFLSPFSFSPPPRTTNQPIQTQKKKQDVSIPIDNATGSHRGFGFVEFEEEGDAAAAALNMDAAEFFGRTLRVNQSQSRIGGGSKRDAVWADGDAWNERQAEADNDGGGGGLLGASGAFKRQEVGGGGGAAAAAAREQPAAAAAASDPMAAAEAALG